MELRRNGILNNPVWVPCTHEQVWALMGSTEKEREEKRAAFRKACGFIEPKRKGMK